MDSNEEIQECFPEHERAAMGRKLRCVQEAMKSHKRLMRHFREETKEKIEKMEELIHDKNVSQKDHEDKVESQRKEQDEITQVLSECLL